MRIGNDLPFAHAQDPHVQNPEMAHNANSAGQGRSQTGPGVVVDISPEGWEAGRLAGQKASERSNGQSGGRSVAQIASDQECQTCKNRRYVDVSDDPSVSFQTPTHISPGQSAAAVSSHEGEHVANEQAKADQEGREIISQTVTLKTSICPECKRVYVSGGTTYTLSMQKPQTENAVDISV